MVQSVSSPSIASQYARNAESFSRQLIWTWPRKQTPQETQPDERLLNGMIANLSAQIRLPNGTTVDAHVRSLTQHDLVLKLDHNGSAPVQGQVAEITVCEGDAIILNAGQCILHWSGTINGESIIALFTVEPMGQVVEKWMVDPARKEIRFPVDLPADVKVDERTTVSGQITDYSLNGCRFVSNSELEIDRESQTQVHFQGSSIEIHLHPRWVTNSPAGYQMGCTFRTEQGVLLACRHHPQPISVTSSPKTQANGWKGSQRG